MTAPLPRAWYLDAEHFRHEMAAVFGRAWLTVAHDTDLAEPGSSLTTTIGGHDIILRREQDGALRAFHNTGTHGTPLEPVKTALLAGFVVVCFDDGAAAPDANLREIEGLLLHDHPRLPVMRQVRRREAVLRANWKAIIENYLECYHCPVAHPSFGDFDLTTWKHMVHHGWSRQGRVASGLDDDHLSDSDIIGLSAW